MTAFFEVIDLVKHFNGVKAVDGVSFSIDQGRCFGLLGPNGAGKTTTIEMMEGIKQPTSGQVRYRGEPLGERFRYEVGIMFQSTALQEFITVRETLRMFQHFYPHAVSLDSLIERFALGEFIDRDTRRISGGQRQRLLLAIALLNDPDIVFLDEPTTGLDPQARRNYWNLVDHIIAQGKTVILTTHYMEEAHALCDEIVIMDHGRIIAQGSPKALLEHHFNETVIELPLKDIAIELEAFPMPVMQCRDHLEISTTDVNAAIEWLLSAGIPLNHLKVRPRTLDDLFLQLTGKELRA